MASKIIRSSRTMAGKPAASGNGGDDTPLPEGFVAAGTFGTLWDPEKNPRHKKTLIGVVGAAGVTLRETADANNKGKTRWSQMVTITDPDGEIWTVWESASTKDWFKRALPGQEVAFVYKGHLPARPGKAAMKDIRGMFKGTTLPEIRSNALPDDFDGSYNYYAPSDDLVEDEAPKAPAKKILRPRRR